MVQNPATSNGSIDFFLTDLATWGPGKSVLACDLPFATEYCRRITRNHYENFTVISLLLPRRLRQDFANFYAFCRWSDDIADESNPIERPQLLDWWEGELQRCFDSQPSHPIMVALQSTIRRHEIPQQPLQDLLNAFRQDQCKNRYATDKELAEYCRCSANPVGRVILCLAQADCDENVKLSDSICTGLQLANFCQDIASDAVINRIYLPQNRWMEHGITEALILKRSSTPALRSTMADWVAYAREHFLMGWPLVDRVPRWLATDVDLFVRGGLAILNAIERQDFDVWSKRPTLSKFYKFKLLSRSLASRWLGIGRHG
jgi:squalene synthase HpnC